MMSAGENVSSGPDSAPLSGQLVFLWVSRIVVKVVASLMHRIARFARPQARTPTNRRHLLIGAGLRGWSLIEYQEIFASASEYLGPDNVSKVTFSGKKPMITELRDALREIRPSHYYFDPRAGSQSSWRAAWETVVAAYLLERYHVFPICALTDFPVKRWRLQTAVVTARIGLVTSLMSPAVVGRSYPHQRIVGPMPFPISRTTLASLQNRKQEIRSRTHPLRDTAVFVGMLYEPRKTTILAIQKGLAERGIPMEILGRMPDGSRIPDSDYWDTICGARLIVSTSSQIAGDHTDFDGHNHFIYKFIEVTAAGTPLAIEPVESSEHLLEPDEHYIAYSSSQEAIEKIAAIWNSPQSLARVAQGGLRQTTSLIEGAYYWRTVFQENLSE